MPGSHLLLSAALAALHPAGAAAAAPVPPSCDGILPRPAAATAPRPIAPLDLVRLRDIGSPYADDQSARAFTVSPDHRRIAFQLRRANPRNNAYCVAMAVMDLAPGSQPQMVDLGDDPIRARIDFRGKADFPTGVPMVITPHWTPDGRWILFRKRSRGITQVWRASTDGNGSEQLTDSEVDVDDFRLAQDGSSIIYAARPGLLAAREAIASEARTGFHYDDRYAAMASSRPFPAMPIARAFFALDLATRVTRAATPAEAHILDERDAMDEEVWTSSRSPSGRRAWTGDPVRPWQPGPLLAERRDGSSASCIHSNCAGASRPWWSPDGTQVRYFRREGWGRATTAIFEWDPDGGAPRRLYATDDVLNECQPLDGKLLCLREGSREPRLLERLDLDVGRRTILFDPNPEFSRLTLGRVERLHLVNSFHYQTVADLVLPVGYHQGQHYPLIVVQYQTRGFLRGGTGDDYPIQAFANRGYAVLSIERPPMIGEDIVDNLEAERLNLADFADRRSTLSTVETGVRLLIDRGIADPARIGLTGMSNGATTVVYALLHSNLFSAVAMSNCCFDTTLPIRVGPAAGRYFRAEGYPGLTDDGAAFWDQISLSRNARRVRTPILVQVADDEYLSALESFTALREVGAPIDMFVFPGERHVKWQPEHRLAVYERALDWFDYWLRGIRSPAPGRQAELAYWDSLRPSASPQPR
jgi:dipeptidyl aminopeptidase/acylaminoacyl peptidase